MSYSSYPQPKEEIAREVLEAISRRAALNPEFQEKMGAIIPAPSPASPGGRFVN
jgi:hypothetical protein